MHYLYMSVRFNIDTWHFGYYFLYKNMNWNTTFLLDIISKQNWFINERNKGDSKIYVWGCTRNY